MNKYLLVLLFFATAISNAFAIDKDFPPVPNPPRLVNDLAGFLKGSEEELLEQKLRAYNDSTSSQIAIVTVESIGQYDISDYTIQLFNKWKIGGKKNNNGILILAAKDERKIWITTGYGLEGALPDGVVGQIIRDKIEPNFKDGNFYAGFDEGIDAIILAARGEYKAEPKHIKQKGGGPGTAVLIIIVILVFLAISRGGRGGGGGGMLNSMGWIAASMLSNGGGRSSGGWGGGSSGGGFGGFGGGSSGGGGAGGSW